MFEGQARCDILKLSSPVCPLHLFIVQEEIERDLHIGDLFGQIGVEQFVVAGRQEELHAPHDLEEIPEGFAIQWKEHLA